MDGQEERQHYERHLTERHLDRFEKAFDSIRDDIKELQKQDSRQHMILMLLVAGLFGLDAGKLAIFKSAIEAPGPSVQQIAPQHQGGNP